MVMTRAIPVADAFIATRAFWQTLGAEAIWRIEVKNFPTLIVIDDKVECFFFKKLNLG
jgi:tartrate dehydratase beta subunit/fumarate hydratase class I family protein